MTLIAAVVTIAVAIIVGAATGFRRGTTNGLSAACGVIAAGVVGYVILLASMIM